MSYRDDLEAAHARIAALEQEVQERDGTIKAIGSALEKAQMTIVADRHYFKTQERPKVTVEEKRVFKSVDWKLEASLPEIAQLMAMVFLAVYGCSWLIATGRMQLQHHRAMQRLEKAPGDAHEP
jgi:GDP-D-mannose dehydratase